MGEKSEERVKDEILVRLCQKGDKKAFEQLVLRYQDRIFSVIYRMLKDRDTVKDIAQDVFIKAFKSINGFKGKSSFYTWLYQIAVHSAINYLSLSRVRTTRSLKDDEIDKGFPGINERSTGNWLEEAYITNETAKTAVAAIDELPVEYKQVVILKEYEDMSYEEIAATLSIPIGTVRSRLNRARKELRKTLRHLAQ